MDKRPRRIAMTSTLNIFILAFVIFVVASTSAKAIVLGAVANGYKSLISMSNAALEMREHLGFGIDNLPDNATLPQLDEVFSSDSLADAYQQKCESILNGPQVFSIKIPKKVGDRTVIGFTEEFNMNEGKDRSHLLAHGGRYLFWWENTTFRATLYTAEQFNDIVKSQSLDISAATEFSFPALAKLVEAGRRPHSSDNISWTHVPEELRKSILADAEKNGYGEKDQYSLDPSSKEETRTAKRPNKKAIPSQENAARFPWGGAAIGGGLIAMVLLILKLYRNPSK